MAQTGYTPILIYSSSTTTNVPSVSNLTNSTLGSELAINITDGKLFYKDNLNAVQVIGWKTVPTSAGGTGLTSYTAGDLIYYASGTTFTKLAIGASGRWLGSSGTAPQWNAPAALTKTDDTNVTLTLGGNASTALLNDASLTLGWTGQLAVTRGGTGLSSVAQGDILYGSAANTLSVLAKNTTATRYLSNTGTSNNPAWAQVDLTNGVTGTLPTGNGGTGLTSFTANGVLYASSSSALATSANLVYDGTNTYFGVGPAGVAPAYAFQVSNTSGELVAFYNNRTSSGGANFRLFKSRGSFASPTVAVANDDIGTVQFRVYARNSGNTADEYVDSARIQAYVSSVDAQNRVSSAIGLFTGSVSSLNLRATLNSAGQFGIGTAAPAQQLEVVGNQRFSGTQVGTKIENRVNAISVSTATSILDEAGAAGRFVIVNGLSGSNRFCDLVLCSTSVSPTVVASFTSTGTPSARTYTRNGSALDLAMASGTYDVHVLALGY